MYRILLTILLLLLAVAPATAETTESLRRISCDSSPGVAHLSIQFTGRPKASFSVSGQRLNIMLKNTTVAADLPPLPEDETVVRTLLSSDRSDLVISVLLRRVPKQVSVRTQPHQFTYDIYWEGPESMRPGIAFDLKGMPVRRGPADLELAQGEPRGHYHGSWHDFFRSYTTPLHLQVTLRPTATDLVSVAAINSGNRAVPALVANTDWPGLIKQLGISATDNVSADYLRAFALAASGRPYRSQVVLESLTGQLPPDGPLLPAVLLLRAELALSEKLPEKAGQLLTGLQKDFPRFAPEIVAGRRADLLAGSKPKQAEALYLELPSRSDFDLYSQARQAETALSCGANNRAQQLFSLLTDRLPEPDQQLLARYGVLLASYRGGAEVHALDDLQKLSEEAPTSEAGLRARMTILDHWVPRLNIDTARKRLADYQLIIDKAPTCALREEAAFKQALGYYFNAETDRAIARLQRNLREFVHGRLKPETEELLSEILPPKLQELLQAGKDFAAVVLVEQNRDLLIRHRLDDELLLAIAAAYRKLGMHEQADRICLYLVDVSKVAEHRQQALLDLAESNLDGGRFSLARHYAELYRKEFPKGPRIDRALLIAALAVGQQGGADQAAPLLRNRDLSRDPALALRAAEMLWNNGDYLQVEACLQKLAGQGKLPPRGQLLNAENLLRLGKTDQALKQFQALYDDPELGDQARYQVAGIELRAKHPGDARALYERIRQQGTDARWKRLADISLRGLNSGP